MNISIAICTYNRAEQLKKTLQYFLESSEAFDAGDELIVIDNNSSDSTAEVVTEFIKKVAHLKLNVQYYFEPEQGLSAARNRAFREYANDYLIFFDDDISVTSLAIQSYRRAFNENADCSFFGGKILVDWGGRQPSWFEADDLSLIRGMVGLYDLGNEGVNYTTSSLLPYGANFALKKELIERIGLFSTDLGVKGQGIGRGEESDYILRALTAGFTGRYVPQAVVEHRFQIQRINLRYFFRYGIAKGNNFKKRRGEPWRRAFASQLIRGIYQLLRWRIGHFYQCVINMGMAWSKRRSGGVG